MDMNALILALLIPIPVATIAGFVWTHLDRWFPENKQR